MIAIDVDHERETSSPRLRSRGVKALVVLGLVVGAALTGTAQAASPFSYDRELGDVARASLVQAVNDGRSVLESERGARLRQVLPGPAGLRGDVPEHLRVSRGPCRRVLHPRPRPLPAERDVRERPRVPRRPAHGVHGRGVRDPPARGPPSTAASGTSASRRASRTRPSAGARFASASARRRRYVPGISRSRSRDSSRRPATSWERRRASLWRERTEWPDHRGAMADAEQAQEPSRRRGERRGAEGAARAGARRARPGAPRADPWRRGAPRIPARDPLHGSRSATSTTPSATSTTSPCVSTAVALVFYLAPSAHHRLRFRAADKEFMVRKGNRDAIAGTIANSIALTGVIYLVTDLDLRNRRGDRRRSRLLRVPRVAVVGARPLPHLARSAARSAPLALIG